MSASILPHRLAFTLVYSLLTILLHPLCGELLSCLKVPWGYILSILKIQRTSLLVLLTAAILVVLAFLQYTWVGDLSDLQFEQAQRTLNATTARFARDLGNEFRRIRATFRVRSDRPLDREILDEYREWFDSSEYPELIVGAYWVDIASIDSSGIEPPPNGGFRLHRAGLADAGLDPIDWSPSFDEIRQVLSDGDGAAPRGRSRQAREWLAPFDSEQFAYVIPQDERGPSGWAVVILDRETLLGKVIPSIVEEYFGVEGEREYLIRILDGDQEGADVLYASDPDASPAVMASPDISRNIADEGADWIVEANHTAGSLEAFVSLHRRRNMSLGFGAVLVLGASFSFLLVATRRARWLANRQMEFVAGVSHELRTPIAGISSLSQNLADGVVHDLDHAARYGETINTESRRLNDMIEKVLHFSAIRSGQYHYELHPVDIRHVVESEIEAIGRYSGRGHRLATMFEEDLPLVLGDSQALRSVVRNLVSNAMKFGKDDADVSIEVCKAEGRNGTRIELAVEDSGEGIPSSDVSHIFEPFYRGKVARALQIRGSGLGLSLVREIVAAHKGRIEVDTREGQGTRVVVYLPVVGKAGLRGSRD